MLLIMELVRMGYKGELKKRGLKRHRGMGRFPVISLLMVFILSLSAYTYLAVNKSFPILKATQIIDNSRKQTTQPAIEWPISGQAAIGSLEDGILASSDSQLPTPIASTAKVITALAVLAERPITSGQGETITLGPKDVDIYNYYVSVNGSNVAVTSGEQITQYQALQALLLPSANNMADSLAIWAFGSMDAYKTYATNLVRNLGATNTTIDDASGFSANTVSTAKDLILIGQKALQNPILKQIVSQKEATIPVAGLVRNVNQLLGTEGIIGIKTGNTDEAGGCLLFAATYDIESKYPITIIGSVTGSANLSSAFQTALALLNSAQANFGAITILQAGAKVGSYMPPWGTETNIHTKEDLIIYGWKGKDYPLTIKLDDVSDPLTASARVGTVTIKGAGQTNTASAIVKASIEEPPLVWRLRHFMQ